MSKIDFLCLCLCAFHLVFSVIEYILARRDGKRIKELCDKCGLPVYENSKHKCLLSDKQLSALYDLVLSLKGDDNGNCK